MVIEGGKQTYTVADIEALPPGERRTDRRGNVRHECAVHHASADTRRTLCTNLHTLQKQ